MFTDDDKKAVCNRYEQRFSEHGYSPKSLGWDKGKQNQRFEILSADWDLNNKSILDVGAGFGDLYKYLSPKFKLQSYTGVELVPVLFEKACDIYKSDSKVKFVNEDFLAKDFTQSFDFVFISGLFNYKLQEGDNYKFIKAILEKSFNLADIAVAADFLSDKVDFCYDYSFHANPAKILDIGYSLTRNLNLRNDYFPFEFALTLNKNQSFSKESTTFDTFINKDNLR